MSGATGLLADPVYLRWRATVAALTRDRATNDPDLVEARRQMALAKVQAKIQIAVDEAPPMPAFVERRCIEMIRAAGSAGKPVAA